MSLKKVVRKQLEQVSDINDSTDMCRFFRNVLNQHYRMDSRVFHISELNRINPVIISDILDVMHDNGLRLANKELWNSGVALEDMINMDFQ